MAHILTTRDVAVSRYLEDHNLIMNVKQIAKMFYSDGSNANSALVMARRRLKVLVDKKYLKRIRSSVSMDYLYYTTKKVPRSPEHKLAISEFLVNFSKLEDVKIIRTEIEYDKFEKVYGLRSDIRIEFDFKNVRYVGLVEVDLTKRFSNTDKYRELIRARGTDIEVEYELPKSRTVIISVCDTSPPMNELMIRWCKPDCTNIDRVLDHLR